MTVRPGYAWNEATNEFIQIGPGAVESPVYYQATEPTSAPTGSLWVNSGIDVPSAYANQYRWQYTATGGETTLSGSGLVYTPGYEQVFLNGVLLVRGQDYTATTGTTISGLLALTAGDSVEILTAGTYPISDTYTQAQADSKYFTKTSSSSSGESSSVNVNTKPWNMPWGIVSLVTSTSSFNTTSSTPVDITGMSTTFNGISNRRYRALFTVSQINGTAGERGRLTITGTNISQGQNSYLYLNPNGMNGTTSVIFVVLSSGSTTVKMQWCRDLGTNSAGVYADNFSPMQLVIEDIGPA